MAADETSASGGTIGSLPPSPMSPVQEAAPRQARPHAPTHPRHPSAPFCRAQPKVRVAYGATLGAQAVSPKRYLSSTKGTLVRRQKTPEGRFGEG